MANSYVDDIKVKISEKYKPPSKISLPMSYSQRVTLNKQIQDSRPTYDFHLEKMVVDKVQEWKVIRKNLIDERKKRLDQARLELEEKMKERAKESLEKEQAQSKLLDEPSRNIVSDIIPKHMENIQENVVTSNGILLPTPATNSLANVLKPVQIQNSSYSNLQTTQVKPFNLSDFESDTSSPFDNMELKSINDLEVLAQVLKNDSNYSNIYQNTNPNNPVKFSQADKCYNPQTSTTNSIGVYNRNDVLKSEQYGQTGQVMQDSNFGHLTNCYTQAAVSQIPPTYNHYTNIYNPQNTTYSTPNPTYNNFNQYMYQNPIQTGNQINLGPSSYAPSTSTVSQIDSQKTTCKSVPDLLKSLEKELENSRISESSSSAFEVESKEHLYRTNNVDFPARPKSTDAVYPKVKSKEAVSNPFEKLTSEQKQLCSGVSMMGFPLDRVARVCLILGNDQKKIVDHLLALSDLLDLGFSEKTASEALVKNDNDRDKALDLLIS
ncbi:hypothetical protein GWI33_012112 [Rhynchophorus ferrugineus]|uniref:Ubiquitin-associated protein 1 n=1 Tax=Rhynchophorus ferrugineus TaxID=354439 RepID=A0A834MEF0_RHYFE|nr:hypothetical protein GWI33_012112 [Rhynchophorus ferrugineus]